MKGFEKFKKVAALLIAFSMIFSTVLIAPASAQEDYNAQIEELQRELDRLGASQKEQSAYQNTLNKQIDAYNAQLNTYNKQLNDLNSQIGNQSTDILALSEQIAQKTQDIQNAEAEMKKTMDQLKKNIRSEYMTGSLSWLEALLNSENFGAFISNFEYIKKIAHRDQDLKEKVEQQIAQVQSEKDELQRQKDDAQAKLNAVETIKQQVSSLRSQIESTAAKLNAKLKDSKDASKKLSEEYQRAKAEQDVLKEAQAEIDSQTDDGGGGGGGGDQSSGFVCPLPAGSYRVSQGFSSVHQAVDLAAGRGTRISASKSGTVITVQYWDGHTTTGMQSYGNMVQIRHDDGSSTLYAHCDTLLVHNGQRVNRGQQIGTVGTTGNSTGYHLHFEMKINGKRVDPIKYI